ncbi:hypothetical protein DSECCO2_172700 [anaerobic digester metagenome]|jgi:hypothetical protein
MSRRFLPVNSVFARINRKNKLKGLGRANVIDLPEAASTALRGISRRTVYKGFNGEEAS